MLTLNQIVKLFEDKKTNHAQLSSGTFIFDESAEWGADFEITYPLFGVRLQPSTLNGNIHTFNFMFEFVDHVHQDKLNQTEVLSDMMSIALDIFAQIKSDLEDYYDATVNITSSFQHGIGVYDDDVTGWQMTVSVEQFYDMSTCETPNSGLNAGVVKILDQNGNVIATLNPNSTYTVEVLQEIIQTLVDPAPVTIIQTLT